MTHSVEKVIRHFRLALCPMPNNYDMKSINDLPDILKKDLETKWEAFKASSKKAGINLSQDSQILDALQRVFVLSNFVADNCIRSPLCISDLIDSGDLQRHYAPKDYDKKLH